MLTIAGPRPSPAADPITILVPAGPFESPLAAAGAEERVRWDDGDPADDDACTESFAAFELRHGLARAIGVAETDIAVSSSAQLPPRGTVFVLGQRASQPLLRSLLPAPRALDGRSGEGYRLRASRRGGRMVYLVEGVGRVGTLYGVYGFLERLGYRFYGLGEMGTVSPRAPVVLPETLDIASSPGYLTRGFWAFEDRGDAEFFQWMARNRMNLWTVAERERPLLKKLGIHLVAGGHSIQKVALDPQGIYPYRQAKVGPTAVEGAPADPYPRSSEFLGDRDSDGRISYFEAHPEWYGLVEGARRDSIGLDLGYNFCTTNPDAVRELVRNMVTQLASGEWRDADVLALWMLDNGKWCECGPCQAAGAPTDKLLALLGAVEGGVRAARQSGALKRPVRLTSLAFLETFPAPSRPIPAGLDQGDVAITYFPIHRCYAHALADVSCTETNAYQLAAFRDWTRPPGRHYHGAIEVGEYYNVSSLHSLPHLLTNVIARDVPWYHRQGVRHFHYMHVPTRKWGAWTLNHLLLSRLLWAPGDSAGAILDEYFALHYPTTGADARRFHAALERATANLKLIKHEVRAQRFILQLKRQMRLGGEAFATYHLQKEVVHPPANDAPDLPEMVAALGEARAAIEHARSSCSDSLERRRLDEDFERFEYGEAMILFFAHLMRLYEHERTGSPRAAREEWPGLETQANRLRRMQDVIHVSSSHVDARDGLEATGMVEEYERYRARFSGSGNPAAKTR